MMLERSVSVAVKVIPASQGHEALGNIKRIQQRVSKEQVNTLSYYKNCRVTAEQVPVCMQNSC